MMVTSRADIQVLREALTIANLTASRTLIEYVLRNVSSILSRERLPLACNIPVDVVGMLFAYTQPRRMTSTIQIINREQRSK